MEIFYEHLKSQKRNSSTCHYEENFSKKAFKANGKPVHRPICCIQMILTIVLIKRAIQKQYSLILIILTNVSTSIRGNHAELEYFFGIA